MRTLKRQRQDVYFCTSETVRQGIDNLNQYSKPVKKKFCVSATAGKVLNGYGNGVTPNYDRYITSYDRDFHPVEGTYIYVDVEPVLDNNGELVLAADGVSPIVAPDYILDKILDTKTGNVARYGITKVGGGSENNRV